MAAASYLQTSFLGGEWSPYFQGRMDDQRYRSALAVCRNAYPLEEGCWTRRPGFRWGGPTRLGQKAILREFHFSQASPYDIELTPGHLRLWSGNNIVTVGAPMAIASFSAGSGGAPDTFTSSTPLTVVTNDSLTFISQSGNNYSIAYVVGQQYRVVVTGTYTFQLYDEKTQAAVNMPAWFSIGTNKIAALKILDFAIPYSAADIALGVRLVQAVEGQLNQAILLNQNHQPIVLSQTDPLAAGIAANLIAPTFTIGAAVFKDGPYLDFVNDGSVLTPSGTAGLVTLTQSYPTWSSTQTYGIGDTSTYAGISYTSLQDANLNNEPDISSSYWSPIVAPIGINDGLGFLPTDRFRSIRLFSEPAAWNSGTAYAIGNAVKWEGTYWTALVANTNVQPDTNSVDWAISTTAAQWVWGRIETILTTGSVTVQLLSGALLYAGVNIQTFRLGTYSDTTGWPITGCYHEGRLVLAGVIPNRFDMSTSEDIFTFTPTGPDGTVADDNGISEVLNASDVNDIFWMISNHLGIVMGTQAGEWLVQASALNDPITPTSIQAHRVTKFGVQNVEPKETPLSIVFVQRYAKRTIEYIADVYSGKLSGTNVALSAKHLTTAGIAELAYQQEGTPVVWHRMNDGTLAGMTYKRESPFGTQPASFSGWHRHDRTDGRTWLSIQAGPSVGGNLDTLMCITQDGTATGYQVEQLTDLFDENTPISNAWFLDNSRAAVGAYLDATVMPHVVRLYGYNHLAGKTVQVWGCGLDLGNLAVSASGEIDIPIDVAGSLFTSALLATFTAQGNIFGQAGTSVNTVTSTITPPAASAPIINAVAEYISNPTLALVNAGSIYSYSPRTSELLVTTGTNTNSTGASLQGFDVPSQVLTSTILGATLYDATNLPSWGKFCVGTDNYIYMMGSSANQGIICKINRTTGLIEAHVGVSGSSVPYQTSPHNTQGFPEFDQVIPVQVGGRNFLIYTSITSITPHMVFFDCDNMWGLNATVLPASNLNSITKLTDYGNPGGGQIVGVAVVSCTNGSTSAVATYQQALLIGSNDQYPSYQINTIGTVAPGALEASGAWSVPPRMIVVDQADGNWLSTAQMASGNQWLFKVNSQTGALMWKLQAPNSGFAWTDGGVFYNQSQIDGYAAFLLNNSGGQNMWFVNTLTGAQISLSALITTTGQTGFNYNCFTGQMLMVNSGLSGAGGAGAPTPISPTPASFANQPSTFLGSPPTPVTPIGTYFAPFIAGYTFTSQGQLLRPIQGPETGARNGPALGKTRRTQDIAMLLYNTQGMQFGTDFTTTTLHACNFTSPGGTPLAANVLYSGVYWDKVEDTYSFNSQPTWQVTRPYPATVLSIEAMLSTQDR